MFGSVRPSVCLSVNALTLEPFDLRPRCLAWGSTLTLARDCRSQVMVKRWWNMFCHHILSPFNLYWGQGQRLRSRCPFSTGTEWSIVELALPSTAKSPMKHKSGTLLKHRVFISRGVQNGCVCNLLVFRQVGRLLSITLLIFQYCKIYMCWYTLVRKRYEDLFNHTHTT